MWQRRPRSDGDDWRTTARIAASVAEEAVDLPSPVPAQGKRSTPASPSSWCRWTRPGSVCRRCAAPGKASTSPSSTTCASATSSASVRSTATGRCSSHRSSAGRGWRGEGERLLRMLDDLAKRERRWRARSTIRDRERLVRLAMDNEVADLLTGRAAWGPSSRLPGFQGSAAAVPSESFTRRGLGARSRARRIGAWPATWAMSKASSSTIPVGAESVGRRHHGVQRNLIAQRASRLPRGPEAPGALKLMPPGQDVMRHGFDPFAVLHQRERHREVGRGSGTASSVSRRRPRRVPNAKEAILRRPPAARGSSRSASTRRDPWRQRDHRLYVNTDDCQALPDGRSPPGVSRCRHRSPERWPVTLAYVKDRDGYPSSSWSTTRHRWGARPEEGQLRFGGSAAWRVLLPEGGEPGSIGSRAVGTGVGPDRAVALVLGLSNLPDLTSEDRRLPAPHRPAAHHRTPPRRPAPDVRRA